MCVGMLLDVSRLSIEPQLVPGKQIETREEEDPERARKVRGETKKECFIATKRNGSSPKREPVIALVS